MKKYTISFELEVDDENGWKTDKSVCQIVEAESKHAIELFAKRLGRIVGCESYSVYEQSD